MRPLGLKPAPIWELYAALKCRSSTVLHAFLGFSAATETVPFPHLFVEGFQACRSCDADALPTTLRLLLPCHFDGTDVPCSGAEPLVLCR